MTLPRKSTPSDPKRKKFGAHYAVQQLYHENHTPEKRIRIVLPYIKSVFGSGGFVSKAGEGGRHSLLC